MMTPDFLAQLNPSQQAAALYTDGPSLIIAGAGSGKTRVLTYKIAYLLQTGIAPYRILALTFTNKAAREMKERIATIVGDGVAAQLWMGTFHSVFSRILRMHAEELGYTSQFTIYDASDSKALVKNIIKELELDDKKYNTGTIASRISTLKNHLVSPENYAADPKNLQYDYFQKMSEFSTIYKQYAARCKQSNAMDFDDLLYNTYRLFKQFPDVLQHYQAQFSQILIDEYQDTNYAQHLIVKMLADTHQQVCVVGDDAQSIYSFRGANIDNILTFQQTFPNCKLFKLEQNYRSTQNIVKAANSLIEKNSNQIRKVIFSENERGNLLELISSYSDYDEAFSITNKIRTLLRSHDYSYADIAILYRVKAQSRVIEDLFRRNNIPYKIYGGVSFYQRTEIKDILAYFRLTINHSDEEALRRIINNSLRGVGKTTQAKVFAYTHTHGVNAFEIMQNPDAFDIDLNKGTKKKLSDFAQKIGEFARVTQTEDAYSAAEKIIVESGIRAEIDNVDTPEAQSQKENIDELLNAIHEFCDRRANEGETNISLPDFLAEVSLLTDQDNETADDHNKVTLMTIHAAKGLEFKNVFIAGLEDQLFPSSLCQTPTEIEEERRLLYVAITRAKENCILSYAKSRFHNGQTQTSSPSRFLKDIDPRFIHQQQDFSTFYGKETAQQFNTTRTTFVSTPKPNLGNFKPIKTTENASVVESLPTENGTLRIGTNVAHATFGTGVVVALEGEGANAKARIKFQNIGEKQLMLKYARLTITD